MSQNLESAQAIVVGYTDGRITYTILGILTVYSLDLALELVTDRRETQRSSAPATSHGTLIEVGTKSNPAMLRLNKHFMQHFDLVEIVVPA